MTVFTPQAQAGSVVLELEYYTEVLRSDNGTEQRFMYRDIPRRQLSYVARTLEAYRTGWLEALLYGGHATQMTVPYWPHAVRLGAQATPGSNVVLSVDTTDREFVDDGYLVLWASERLAEECTITAVSSTSVTVATLVGTWAAGSWVIPAWRGNFTGSPELQRTGIEMADVAVEFLMEVGQDPNATDVTSAAIFTVVPVNRIEVAHTYERLVDRVEGRYFQLSDFRRRNTPVGARPYVLWLEDRAAVADLVTWFHQLRGRLRPFWMPTFQQDLEVLSGLGTSTIVISECGYSTWLTSTSRRHLAFIEPNGTVTRRSVTAAVDNEDGTESLTLSGTAPAGTSIVSYMLYGRLESDTLRLEWQNNAQAECAIGFVELPGETPSV